MHSILISASTACRNEEEKKTGISRYRNDKFDKVHTIIRSTGGWGFTTQKTVLWGFTGTNLVPLQTRRAQLDGLEQAREHVVSATQQLLHRGQARQALNKQSSKPVKISCWNMNTHNGFSNPHLIQRTRAHCHS